MKVASLLWLHPALVPLLYDCYGLLQVLMSCLKKCEYSPPAPSTPAKWWNVNTAVEVFKDRVGGVWNRKIMQAEGKSVQFGGGGGRVQ